MLLIALFRLLARLLPLILALCAVMPVFSGRRVDVSSAWQAFGFGACILPCYAGITPGVTPFDGIYPLLVENVPQLDRHMIASGSALNFWATIPSQRLTGLIRYERGLVGEIRLNAVLPLAAVITELGTPDCILLSTGGEPERSTVIFWERGEVSIAAVLERNQSLININGDARALWLRIAVPGDCSLRGALPWRGFAPLWTYSR
ncbi:MAG: hypothetical protein IT319_01725 [Anaerolineae bacterium]|nr:hypothetical protein [Anaerolineae bacterium]